ncbi:MAG TPA: helix-turn-helix transcriptional regulator [Candidatus Limnocylindria bacterium]|nr:helix-turn-helix transcriptional regulator [Candidatus Limnocylindria bacterium]
MTSVKTSRRLNIRLLFTSVKSGCVARETGLDVATIGEELRRRREEMGLQQSEVAERLGVSRVSVSNWERDVTMPLEENFEQLAKLFGTTVRDLRYPPTVAIVNAEIPLRIEAHATTGGPKQEAESVSWPQAARVLVRRFELEAAESGASDEDLDFVRRVLTSPESYLMYAGGRAREMTEAELLVEMQGLMEGLRVWLRERIRRRVR